MEEGTAESGGQVLAVEAQIDQLRHFLPLVEKVITQTKKRVWGGTATWKVKVLSLFEPHTEVIRKGKAHQPNEFGRLVRIDEVKNGIVSAYQVLTGNPADYHILDCRPSNTSSVLRVRGADGHGRSRFFLRQRPACGAKSRGKESSAASARTSLVKRAKQQKQRGSGERCAGEPAVRLPSAL